MLSSLERVVNFLLLKPSGLDQLDKDDSERWCREERARVGAIDIRIDYGFYRSTDLSKQAYAIFMEPYPLVTFDRTRRFVFNKTQFKTSETFDSINAKSSTGVRSMWAVKSINGTTITLDCNTDINRDPSQGTAAIFTMSSAGPPR